MLTINCIIYKSIGHFCLATPFKTGSRFITVNLTSKFFKMGTKGEKVDEILKNRKNFDTLAIHEGQEPSQWTHKAVIPPICMSTTFEQYAPADHAGYEYSRSGNPTRNCLERAIAALESAKYGIDVLNMMYDSWLYHGYLRLKVNIWVGVLPGLCFSSGLAATATLTHLLKSGDHIISFDDVYGGTNRYYRRCASNYNLETTFVDARDPENVKNALRPNTKMVWMETPTNPTMKLVDIKAVAAIVKEHSNAVLVVDNTFMSPYFQKPLMLGADIVMHSVSKYINGHSDVIMGTIATNNIDLYEKIKFLQNALGAIPSPFDSYLVNRGLKTLHVRMERHQENGLAVARHLEKHPAVERVLHPGLPSHPQHSLALRQCSGFSGMVSVYLHGQANEFVRRLQLFTLAESLGSIESLVEIPSLMTHMSVPEEQRKELGITDNLVRLSVGLEAKEDLLADLDQALEGLRRRAVPVSTLLSSLIKTSVADVTRSNHLFLET
ncbi:CTH [Cordylochernes scorpioides]|uniref:cystathionine gamma-lyase n=1 Tax=Cordylochernes scorpioides TaxID=51811 RepID=A0ABY6KKL6_9ARAC|nr:CTH [Cordylochernes scorpioides]